MANVGSLKVCRGEVLYIRQGLYFTILFLLFWSMSFFVQSHGLSFIGINFCHDARNKGYRLNTTVSRNLYALSGIDCVLLCIQNDQCCRSVNYRKSPLYDGKENCELLYTVASEHPGYLMKDKNYDYYVLLQPNRTAFDCRCSACTNDGTCDEHSKKCSCQSGFTGKQCEEAPDTCRKVQQMGLSSGDGEYRLYLQLPTCLVSARIYCADMNSDTPTEYVTLPAGRTVNFAFDNRPISIGLPRIIAEHGKTEFEKIRLKLPERMVQLDDWRFAVLVSGNVNKSYGFAGDCVWRDCDEYVTEATGQSIANLVGTDFKFPQTIPYFVHFFPKCANRSYFPSMSPDRKVWSVKCGGYCGECRPEQLILNVDGC